MSNLDLRRHVFSRRAKSFHVNSPRGAELTRSRSAKQLLVLVRSASGSMNSDAPAADIYTWGNNSIGQCGHGRKADSEIVVPRAVRVLRELSVTVSAVATGSSHVVALTSTGMVLVWGDGAHGKLGQGTVSAKYSPSIVPLLRSTKCTAVGAGEHHSAAVDEDGHVYTWGLNNHGQLGNGDRTTRLEPVGPLSVPDAVSVTCSTRSTFITTEDGDVYGSGELWPFLGGDSSRHVDGFMRLPRVEQSPVALKAFLREQVLLVSCSARHALVLCDPGRVLAMGANERGQLGVGHADHVPFPQLVVDLENYTVTGIAAGYAHSACVTEDGKLLTWGDNAKGQLGLTDGDGHTSLVERRSSPGVVPIFEDRLVSSVSCGHWITAVVLENGQLFVWGEFLDAEVQFVQADSAESSPPPSASAARAARAPRSDGKILPPELMKLRGQSALDYTPKHRRTISDPSSLPLPMPSNRRPLLVKSLLLLGKQALVVSCGGDFIVTVTRDTLAKKPPGPAPVNMQITSEEEHLDVVSLAAYEDRESPFALESNSPRDIPLRRRRASVFFGFGRAPDTKRVSAAWDQLSRQGIAMDDSSPRPPVTLEAGLLAAFGRGSEGQLGLGVQCNSRRATVLRNSQGNNLFELPIEFVACGVAHCVAIRSDGRVFSWGSAGHGRLGIGREKGQVNSPALVEHLADRAIVSAACGWRNAAFVDSSGRVYVCGANDFGQLGLGHSHGNAALPVSVSSLASTTISSVTISGQPHEGEHIAALSSSGGVYAWGCGQYGKLGIRAAAGSSIATPMRIVTQRNGDLLPPIAIVRAGASHTVLVGNDGLCYSCGNGATGALGHGSLADEFEPRLIEALQEVKITDVSPGRSHTVFLSDKGRVASCGFALSGSLCHGTDFDVNVPRWIEFLDGANVTKLSIGSSALHTLVVTDEGSVYSFGAGESGQLGHEGLLHDESMNIPLLAWSLMDAVHRVAAISTGMFHTVALSAMSSTPPRKTRSMRITEAILENEGGETGDEETEASNNNQENGDSECDPASVATPAVPEKKRVQISENVEET